MQESKQRIQSITESTSMQSSGCSLIFICIRCQLKSLVYVRDVLYIVFPLLMILPNSRIYLSESFLHIGASLSEAIKIYLLDFNISLPESNLGDIYLYQKLPRVPNFHLLSTLPYNSIKLSQKQLTYIYYMRPRCPNLYQIKGIFLYSSRSMSDIYLHLLYANALFCTRLFLILNLLSWRSISQIVFFV